MRNVKKIRGKKNEYRDHHPLLPPSKSSPSLFPHLSVFIRQFRATFHVFSPSSSLSFSLPPSFSRSLARSATRPRARDRLRIPPSAPLHVESSNRISERLTWNSNLRHRGRGKETERERERERKCTSLGQNLCIRPAPCRSSPTSGRVPVPDQPFCLIEGSPGYDVPFIPEIHRITGVRRDGSITVPLTAKKNARCCDPAVSNVPRFTRQLHQITFRLLS